MFGILSDEAIEKLIEAQLVGRIGCHADDITYVVPVSYAYDGNYIYVRTFDGTKMQILRKNPKVCFQIDDIHNLANWRSVILWGVFEELTDTTQRKNALGVLASRRLPPEHSQTMELSGLWPFPRTMI
ncbi:MAG: pyridoxamine 5'-phosphate oxidase family protein [Agriterribacter sp.]